MNQLFRNEFTEPAEEMKKLIANIKNNLDLYESADKFVKVVEKNNLDQKEDFIPLLLSFCDALREKGYPVMSETFAEKWHMK
ncbi:MAG: hypothetical protein MUO31_16140 [Thermodesulfovibrionales bacterium]|nr:hypothetical protein [Thermodesulfovibrionales bacterium]